MTALNCSAPTAYQEFIATKNLYHKNNGRMYYHLVQSFPKGYDISPELAHKIAVEFSEKSFGNFECVVATHIDCEHIHSHIVFSSVSFTDGKKYLSNADSVKNLMALSDEICIKYGVPVLKKPVFKKDSDTISDREYRCAVKGESYTVAFNGNREVFENFINFIITDYLNSTGEADFIQNVELSVESA